MTTDQSPTSTHPSSYLYIVVDTNSLVASTTSTRYGSMAIKKLPEKVSGKGLLYRVPILPIAMYPKSLPHTPTYLYFPEKNIQYVEKGREKHSHHQEKTKNKIRKLPLYYFKSSRRLPYIHITLSHQTSVPPIECILQASIQNRETFSDSMIIMYIPQQPIRSIQAQRPTKPYRASHAVEKAIPSTSMMPVASPTQKTVQAVQYSTVHHCI